MSLSAPRDAAGVRPAPWPTLALALGFPTLLTLAYFVLLAGQPRGLVQAVYGAGKAAQFALPLAVALRLGGRLARPRWSRSRGLPGEGAGASARAIRYPGGRGALLGAGFGAALLAAALALYHLALRPAGLLPVAAIRAKIDALGVADPVAFAALGAFYSLVHSAAEEYYWRWFVFGELRRRLALPLAVAGSSAGFAAHHVVVLAAYFGWASPMTYLLAAAVGVGGAFWAWLYQRSGSLLGPWLGHLLADAALFTIGWDLLR